MRLGAGRIALAVLAVIVVGVAIFGVAKWREINRVRFVSSMFSGVEQVDRFRDMDSYFPVRAFQRSGPVSVLPAGSKITLPETFDWYGETREIASFLDETDTTGLLLAKGDGTLVYDKILYLKHT